MAKFLRDEHLKNVTIDEATLDLIYEFLTDRKVLTNAEFDTAGADQDGRLLLKYIIRFDNRGYTLNEFADIKKYYAQASRVERIIFTLDSAISERTNRLYGTHFEIRFDSNDSNNTYIQVASDDRDAVDSVFTGLLEIIKKCKNNNHLIRNSWSKLLVQIFGVATGFLISLIASLKISPQLNFDNSFVITFIFAFLIFSNTWGYINQQILRFVDYSCPNVRFNRVGKNALNWLYQAIIGGLVVAITILLFSYVAGWIGKILGQYINQ